ncbi:MAG: FAD:protein FMN transferase [Ilumatobacteraceae bacterium]
MEAVELRGRVMASELHIVAIGATAAMLDDAVDRLEHLERCWSRFIPTSDISRINTVRSGGLAVDDSTLTLLNTMIEGYRLTEGRFDPRVLPALVAQGYAASRVDPTRTTVLPATDAPPASLEAIRLDPAAGMVDVPTGLALDPGGIGKGLAADLAVARLVALGARGALVSIGGDLAMAGETPVPEGWLVAVEQADPADGTLCTLAVSGGGVATSSTRSRRWVVDGTERHHQIDPATSLPSTTDLAAVTIIARAGWLAEVHATAAMACGSAGALGYMAAHGLSGIAIGHDGTVHRSPDLAGIEMRTPAGAR